MSSAKKGDFIAVESVSRITTLDSRHAVPPMTTIRIGTVGSASRDGIAKTFKEAGMGTPRKLIEVSGFKFAHVVSAENFDVAGALAACSGRDFATVRELVDHVKGFRR